MDLKDCLRDLNANWKYGRFVVTYLPEMLSSYETSIDIDKKKESIENFISGLEYDVARPLLDCTAFEKNAGYKASKNILIKKYCELHPEQTFAMLRTALVKILIFRLLIA